MTLKEQRVSSWMASSSPQSCTGRWMLSRQGKHEEEVLARRTRHCESSSWKKCRKWKTGNSMVRVAAEEILCRWGRVPKEIQPRTKVQNRDPPRRARKRRRGKRLHSGGRPGSGRAQPAAVEPGIVAGNEDDALSRQVEHDSLSFLRSLRATLANFLEATQVCSIVWHNVLLIGTGGESSCAF